jgi:hypothetical protein
MCCRINLDAKNLQEDTNAHEKYTFYDALTCNKYKNFFYKVDEILNGQDYIFEIESKYNDTRPLLDYLNHKHDKFRFDLPSDYLQGANIFGCSDTKMIKILHEQDYEKKAEKEELREVEKERSESRICMLNDLEVTIKKDVSSKITALGDEDGWCLCCCSCCTYKKMATRFEKCLKNQAKSIDFEFEVTRFVIKKMKELTGHLGDHVDIQKFTKSMRSYAKAMTKNKYFLNPAEYVKDEKENHDYTSKFKEVCIKIHTLGRDATIENIWELFHTFLSCSYPECYDVYRKRISIRSPPSVFITSLISEKFKKELDIRGEFLTIMKKREIGGCRNITRCLVILFVTILTSILTYFAFSSVIDKF